MNDDKHLADLQASLSSGTVPEFLFFWGHTPKNDGVGKWCLSQWWEAPFTVDGQRYRTAEHYMMAEKARLFGDAAAAAKVLAAKKPRDVNAIGRTVRGFDDAVWAENRFRIVVKASVEEFGANPALRDFLLGTQARVLVEASPPDRVWGIGLAEDDPRAKDPAMWRGLNLLGFALMAARDQL